MSCVGRMQKVLQRILQRHDAANCESNAYRFKHIHVLCFLFPELKYFRDGATLVISMDGFNWLPKKRCSDKEIKKRYYLYLVNLDVCVLFLVD